MERRLVVLGAAAAMVVGVFVSSLLSTASPGGTDVLYVIPVTLVGLELGMYGGAAGALLASGLLLASWAHHGDVSAIDICASTVTFLAAGMLAGRFSERMRAGHRQQERLLASGLRLARLQTIAELPGLLVEELQQTLDPAGVQVVLTGAPVTEAGSLDGETRRLEIASRGIEFGSLTIGLPRGRGFSEEDRIVAAKLAQQAAVAVDNQRLLAAERDRAVLQAELEQLQGRLADHHHDVEQILDRQEADREAIARHLHEGAAQAMAGLLLGLQVLERDLDRDLTRAQLDEVRTVVRDTLADVRQLAVSVRPPALDQLGLGAALEGLAERQARAGSREITLCGAQALGDLPAGIQTGAYRVVEDAIQALDGPLHISMTIDEERLRITLAGHEEGNDELHMRDLLATARARIELVGGSFEFGSLDPGTVRVIVRLPLG